MSCGMIQDDAEVVLWYNNNATHLGRTYFEVAHYYQCILEVRYNNNNRIIITSYYVTVNPIVLVGERQDLDRFDSSYLHVLKHKTSK